MNFTALTLLSAGSIHVGGVAGMYNAASIAKLGLDHQVRAPATSSHAVALTSIVALWE